MSTLSSMLNSPNNQTMHQNELADHAPQQHVNQATLSTTSTGSTSSASAASSSTNVGHKSATPTAHLKSPNHKSSNNANGNNNNKNKNGFILYC